MAILEGQYFFPKDDTRISEKLKDLIRHLLTPNPDNWPSIFEVNSILQKWDKIEEIELNPDAEAMKRSDTRKGWHEAPKTRDLSPWTLMKLSEQLKRE